MLQHSLGVVYVVFAVKENSYFHFLCGPASQSEKALEFKLCRLRRDPPPPNKSTSCSFSETAWHPVPTPSSTRPTEHHVLMAILSMRIISPSVSSHHTCDHVFVCLSQLPARVERTSSPSPTLKPVRTWPSPLSSTSRCASVLTLTRSSVSDQVKHANTASGHL